jgi:cytoskeletal protein RodZ
MRWLVTVVVIVVAVFLGYRYFYSDQGQQMAQQVEETTDQAAEAVGQAADQAAETVEGATEQATESTEQAADQAADTAEQAAESAGDATAALTVEGVDLGKEIGTTVSDATSALGGITDKASAEAALPDLKAVDTKLGELGGKIEQLPADAKKSLASLLGDMLPKLQDVANKVEGMEGVGEVVKPTLDSIMAKLDGWAKQPA